LAKHKLEEFKINIEAFAEQASKIILNSYEQKETVVFVNVTACVS